MRYLIYPELLYYVVLNEMAKLLLLFAHRSSEEGVWWRIKEFQLKGYKLTMVTIYC